MLRRAFLTAVTLGLLATRPARAADRLDAETIKAALRTADVEEDGFVERVVRLARGGDLPPSMVESTSLWARRKPRHRFQYFKRAMNVRAAQIGIDL